MTTPCLVSEQADRIARHKAFWRRTPGSGPILGLAPSSHVFPLQNIAFDHDGRLMPADLTEDVIQAEAGYHSGFMPDDALLPGKIPMEFMEWSQAYCGAEVYLSKGGRTVWTKPGADALSSSAELEGRVHSKWLDKLVEVTRANISAAEGRWCVTESLIRGPADCLEAVLGAERFCLMLFDAPEAVASMMEFLTDRVVELIKAQLNVLPRIDGGTVNRYRLIGAGDNIVTQADISNILSPDHFREFVIPFYARLASEFDTVTIHFHSCAHQHAAALIEAGCFDAIEWGMDPTGPTLPDMVPIFRKILESDLCLILMNIHSEEEVNMLLGKLPHEGLCVIKRDNQS
jgi:hypothetical protein